MKRGSSFSLHTEDSFSRRDMIDRAITEGWKGAVLEIRVKEGVAIEKSLQQGVCSDIGNVIIACGSVVQPWREVVSHGQLNPVTDVAGHPAPN